MGLMCFYKNKPFTGIAYSLYDNGDIQEEQEMVEGLKHGQGKLYLENGNLVCTLNYIDDTLDPKDEKKFQEYMLKVMKIIMMK